MLRTLPQWACWLPLLAVVTAGPQSNYNLQNLDVEFEEISHTKEQSLEGLPEFGTLDGIVTELDTISSSIKLSRTNASLNCASGYMHIDLKFQQKFFGIVYAQKDRNSACKVAGKGEETAKIDIPLKGCGTVQDNTRVFKNDIVVRFHPGLEIEGDEVITVICRYPPPVVQEPVIPLPIQLPDEPVLALQPLREFEILLIICAIIFLALLLLGIGCSYYCLKKRNIRVIRRRPASTIGSEVTRISDPPSMFAGLKIPRAHATDTSGSEEMTESVHTDYGTDVSSIPSVEEFQSAYSDLAGEVDENIVYPDLHEPPMPAFDTKMRIKKKAGTLTPISSRASSVTEEMLAAQEQYLTTILERTETNTMETLERVRKSKAELGPPPVHARLRVQHNIENMTSRESDSESQYSHDPLGTDLEFTEDERETAVVNRAMVSSDRLQSARLVESVQTRQSEHVTRREQEVRERAAARHVQAGFDVTVRTTEGHGHYSDEDTASMSEYTTHQEPIEPVLIDRRGYSKSEMRSMQQNMSQSESGSMRQQQSKFDVLIRVLDAAPPSAGTRTGAGTSDDLTSVFSEDDRQRWRDIVTHDSTFRTMIESAQTTEDVTSAVSQIRYISKYEKMFEPHKWDVLVRVLQTPGSISGKSMSSKSSKSYKTSKSGTEYDLRSVAETTVDFAARRSEFDSESSFSGRSGHHSQYTAGARSMADRSGTEITEYHSYMYAESHGTRSTSRPSLGHITADDDEF